jgi:hypothetical protein
MIEIPESAIVDAATVPPHPSEPAMKILDRELFLTSIAEHLMTCERDSEDFTESEMRALVREASQSAALEALGVAFVDEEDAGSVTGDDDDDSSSDHSRRFSP